MDRKTTFPGWVLPLLMVAPQLALTVVFFLWPAGEALRTSLTRADPFGLSEQFVGLANFERLFADPLYLATLARTGLFCAAVTGLAMALALLFAVFADHEIRGRAIYRTVLIWPYAVAPAIAGVVWILMLHPDIGWLAHILKRAGIAWNYKLDGAQAMTVVVLASAWKQVSYNFIFYLAALQSIPRGIVEAASLDGAGAWRRFRAITLPLIAPTTAFLLIVNTVYAAFETFGTIAALTQGGPAQATTTLVVKVYRDGVLNLDLGSSSAQSIVLMGAVILLTALQFRVLRRPKDYA